MRGRRFGVILAVATAGLVLLAGGFFPQEPVRRLAESQVRKAFGPRSRIGTLHVVPARLRLEMTDVALDGASFRATASRLEAAASPGWLLGGALSFREITIDGGRLTARATSSSPSGPWARPVTVERLTVTAGGLEYDDPALGGSVTLQGLEAHGGVGSGSLEISISDGVWKRPQALTLAPSQARLRVSSLLDIEIESSSLSTGPSHLACRGTLGRVGAFAPRLDLEGQIDLAEAARIAAFAPLTGTVSVHGHVDNAAGALTAKASVEGTRLTAAEWPVQSLEAAVDYDGSGTGHMAATVSSSLLGGRAGGKAQLEGRVLTAEVKADGLDLAQVARPGESGVGGTASASLRLSGDVDHPLELGLDADARVVAGSQTTSVHADAAGTVGLRRLDTRVTWKVTADGVPVAPEASVPRLISFGAVAAGSAQGPWPPMVEGNADVQVATETPHGPEVVPLRVALHNQGAVVSIVADARPFGGVFHAEADTRRAVLDRLALRAERIALSAVMPGAKGSLEIIAEASGPLGELTGRASAQGTGLEWDGIPVGSASVELNGVRGRHHVTLDVPDLRVKGEAVLPVDHEARGTLTLAGSPLAPLAPLLPEGSPLEGEVSGTLAFQVPLSATGSPRVQGEVARLSAASGRLSAEATQTFHVTLDKDVVGVEGLSLKGPGYTLVASGRFGLANDSPLEGSSSLDADLEAAPVPEGWTLSGRLRADVALAGTGRNPLATGSVVATGISFEGPSIPLTTIDEGRLTLGDGTATLAPTKAVLADGSLTLAGQMPLALALRGSKGGATIDPAHVEVSWEGLQAAALLARVTTEGSTSVAAVLAGHAEVIGDPFSVETLHGSATLASTTVRLQDFSLNLTPLEVSLDQGRLSTVGVTAWTEQGSLQLAGSVDLPRRTLGVSANGGLELRSLSPLVGSASLAGAADVSVSARGTFDAPELDGKVWVRDATVRLRDVSETLSALNGTVALEKSSIRLEDVTGVVGGGVVRVTGGAHLEGLAVAEVALDITGRDMALRHPTGLRSRVEADLSLKGRSGALQLGGQVRVLRGLYDLDVALQQSVKVVTQPAPSPAMRAIGLDLRVSLDSPIMVRNKLAVIELGGSLSFGGDMETPLPIGHIDIRPGGRITLQGRDFKTSAGGLSYTGSWNPTVSLRADRRIRDAERQVDYDVSLVAEGALDVVQPLFEAPGLSSAEAFSLVATGRTTNTSLSSGAKIAGGAAASMLVGRVSGNLGLDEVTVQPELLARETDPGTRFTFGKQISKAMSLIYSIGLQGPEDRFLQLEVRPWRSTSLKVQRSDDGTVTYGAGQNMTFGGAKRPEVTERSEKVTLTEIRLEGDRPVAEERLRQRLKSRVGKTTTSWGVQEDADRLRAEFVRENFLESEVSARLEATVASFRIRSGPRFAWTVTGMTDPPDLDDDIRKALFEEEALERGRAVILATLRRRGFLRAEVKTGAGEEAGLRRLRFEAVPGPHLLADVSFPGASVLSQKRLLEAAGGAAAILTAPEVAGRGVLEAYKTVHRFDVSLEPPHVDDAAGRVVIRWPVSEGSPAVVASVRFAGNSRPASDLGKAADLTTGAAFTDTVVSEAAERLRKDYFRRGFPKSRVSAEVTPRATGVDVLFRVVEGSPVRVGRIEIAGLRHTRESVVRRRIPLKTGAPLDPRRLSATERRLMELGIFSRVSATAAEGDPADVLVTVEEGPRGVASYDVRYNDEDHTTVQVDGETRNIAGVGLVVGGRYRIGETLREARGSVFLPSVIKSGNLTGSIFRTEQDEDAIDPFTLEPFTNTTTESGFQIQQKVPLGRRWDLLPGYRFKTEHSTAFPEAIDLSGLDASLARDTRDHPLDAHKGEFLSLNVQYDPKALASDFTFVKSFAQAFLTRPIGKSWFWAQAYRLGLAKGFGGQEIIFTERFKAGGSNSLRGYATDSLGPRDLLGEPTGGEAVVIVNEEIRYRHPSRLGFALFYDGGNVFDTISDMSFHFRHDLGFGLRWESPVGLLRVDLGFPLSRRAGEEAYQLWLSFGQAF